MGITRTTSGSDLPSGFPFALASTANGLCFISGMPALNPEGTYQEGTFEEEVALAWHNITSIANAAGFSVDEIVYVQCVIADIANYGLLNDWWRRQFLDVATGETSLFLDDATTLSAMDWRTSPGSENRPGGE